jgi:hypothetical protein
MLDSAAGRRHTSGMAKRLLAAGVAAGPVFYGIVLAQALTRSGFDITRHPLSLLSLGEAGWVQMANFMLAGFLAFAGAVGLRQRMASGPSATWGPLLIALFGAGTIFAGAFRPDPAFGFPDGAPAGAPTQISAHSIMHGVGFDLAFLSLIAAAFVFARRYAVLSRPKWRAYCIATGAVMPTLIVAGIALQHIMGILFLVAGMVAFGWLTAIAWHERKAVPI